MKNMGDGIEPIIKGAFSTIASGIVGIAHGMADTYLESSAIHAQPLIHNLVSYAPIASSGAYVASSKYGLYGFSDRVSGFIAGVGFSAGATTVGYFAGRVVSEGFKAVLK